MNPGFIDQSRVAPGRVLLDVLSDGLQPCLEELLKRWYPQFLDPKKRGAPSPCDRVRIALVNLTGAHWFTPELALWGGTYPMETGSIVKVLLVYALYQLRYDLRELAKSVNPSALESQARKLWNALPRRDQPAVQELFDLAAWDHTPAHLDFNAATKRRLDAAIHCNDNCAAGRLIVHVGFSFIGSVALQSRLFEPLMRG